MKLSSRACRQAIAASLINITRARYCSQPQKYYKPKGKYNVNVQKILCTAARHSKAERKDMLIMTVLPDLPSLCKTSFTNSIFAFTLLRILKLSHAGLDPHISKGAAFSFFPQKLLVRVRPVTSPVLGDLLSYSDNIMPQSFWVEHP